MTCEKKSIIYNILSIKDENKYPWSKKNYYLSTEIRI